MDSSRKSSKRRICDGRIHYMDKSRTRKRRIWDGSIHYIHESRTRKRRIPRMT